MVQKSKTRYGILKVLIQVTYPGPHEGFYFLLENTFFSYVCHRPTSEWYYLCRQTVNVQLNAPYLTLLQKRYQELLTHMPCKPAILTSKSGKVYWQYLR